MPLPDEVDILIVGAGPVGTAAACALLNNLPSDEARGALKLLLVDRHPALDHIPIEQSRALGLHARTFEALSESIDDKRARTQQEQQGIRDRASAPLLDDYGSLLQRGILLTKFTMRTKGSPTPLLSNNIPELITDSQFPYVCIVQQRITEAVLRARLAALGGHLEGGWRIVSLEQHGKENPLTVTLEHDKLGRHTLQAGFVVGADGGHSAVRRLTGLSFPKQSWKDAMITADIKVADPDWPIAYRVAGYHGLEGGDVYCPLGFCVIFPMPDNWIRVAMSFVPPDFATSLGHMQEQAGEGGGHVEMPGPTVAQMQWACDQCLPTNVEWREGAERVKGKRPGDIVEMRWSATFKIHEGIVSSYLDPETARIALVGDAAHVHSPRGGRGLNNGILDAITLSHTLLAHPASDVDRQRALEGWAQRRRDIGRAILRESSWQTTLATLRHPLLQRLRNGFYRLLAFFPSLTRAVVRRVAGLDQRPVGWTAVV